MRIAPDRIPAAAAIAVLTAITPSARAHAAPPSQATPTPPTAICPPCVPPPPPFEAMQAADATFFGRVVDADVNAAAGDRLEATFHVTETWTTDTVAERTAVDVPHDVWACGRRPAVGESWMIYARRGDDGRLAIGHCDRSHVADAGPDPLGTGCDPVRGLWLDVVPQQVKVGEAFTVRSTLRSLSLMEFTLTTDPPGAAVVEPPCPMPCQPWRSDITLRAVTAGRIGIHVAAFGEDLQCHRSARVWNWTYPSASADVVIRPAGPPYRIWLPTVACRAPPLARGSLDERPFVVAGHTPREARSIRDRPDISPSSGRDLDYIGSPSR